MAVQKREIKRILDREQRRLALMGWRLNLNLLDTGELVLDGIEVSKEAKFESDKFSKLVVAGGKLRGWHDERYTIIDKMFIPSGTAKITEKGVQDIIVEKLVVESGEKVVIDNHLLINIEEYEKIYQEINNGYVKKIQGVRYGRGYHSSFIELCQGRLVLEIESKGYSNAIKVREAVCFYDEEEYKEARGQLAYSYVDLELLDEMGEVVSKIEREASERNRNFKQYLLLLSMVGVCQTKTEGFELKTGKEINDWVEYLVKLTRECAAYASVDEAYSRYWQKIYRDNGYDKHADYVELLTKVEQGGGFDSHYTADYLKRVGSLEVAGEQELELHLCRCEPFDIDSRLNFVDIREGVLDKIGFTYSKMRELKEKTDSNDLFYNRLSYLLELFWNLTASGTELVFESYLDTPEGKKRIYDFVNFVYEASIQGAYDEEYGNYFYAEGKEYGAFLGEKYLGSKSFTKRFNTELDCVIETEYAKVKRNLRRYVEKEMKEILKIKGNSRVKRVNPVQVRGYACWKFNCTLSRYIDMDYIKENLNVWEDYVEENWSWGLENYVGVYIWLEQHWNNNKIKESKYALWKTVRDIVCNPHLAYIGYHSIFIAEVMMLAQETEFNENAIRLPDFELWGNTVVQRAEKFKGLDEDIEQSELVGEMLTREEIQAMVKEYSLE